MNYIKRISLLAIVIASLISCSKDIEEPVKKKEDTKKEIAVVTTPKKLKIVALHEQLGIENPGALRKMVKHNGKVYLKIMKSFTKEMVWYIYESGKSLTKVTPPNNVLIRSSNKFHYGVNYQGKYYYPVENKTEHALYTFNEGAGTTQKVAMKYPEGFNAINNLTVFNNKLYFTANSRKNGFELFSYTPAEGLKLLPQIADGYFDKDKRFGISSKPTNLFVWNDYLVFVAQEDKRPDTGKYGRELYKLDKKGNISILNDFFKGSKGSGFRLQPFLSKQTGQAIIYNYFTRKFFVLNNDFSITAFSYGDVANNTYEIKGRTSNNDYLALAARTKKSPDLSHITPVYPVIIEKSGATHLFPKISHDVMIDGIFWKGYYIFPGEEEDKIGFEPYAINLKTWKATMLKDIRTKPWNKGSMGFVVYGSNPTTFTVLDNEILFQAELDDKTANYATFIITEEK